MVECIPGAAVAVEQLQRGEFREGWVAGVVLAESAEDFGSRGVGFVVRVGSPVYRVEVEEIGFGFFDAAQGPAAFGDVEDGELFGVALVIVDEVELFEHGLEESGIFVIEDLVGGEAVAVFAGVLRGGGFAFGRTGSGGELGVGSVALGEGG